MKKIIYALLLCSMIVTTVAVAEENVSQPIELTNGMYVVGKDVNAGAYMLTVTQPELMVFAVTESDIGYVSVLSYVRDFNNPHHSSSGMHFLSTPEINESITFCVWSDRNSDESTHTFHIRVEDGQRIFAVNNSNGTDIAATLTPVADE